MNVVEPTPNASSTPSNRWKHGLWMALVVLLIAVLLVLFGTRLLQWIQSWNWDEFRQQIEDAGVWGPIWCMILMVVFTLFSLPTTAITIVATLVFGLGKGLCVAMLGLSFGVATTFLLARHGVRPWLESRIGHTKAFRAIYESTERGGWKIVLFSRLMPVNPFWFLNVAFGLTGVGFFPYWIASIVGIFPFQLAVAWTSHTAGEMTIGGRVDYRVFFALFACALLFAAIAWLPKWIQHRKASQLANRSPNA